VDPERLTCYFYFQFAVAAEQAGDATAAERYLKKSLELNPDFTPAQNYLGYMWADAGEHLEEALELIEKAVEVEPENPAYLDSLGWVLFKLDRPELALEKLMKAVELLDAPDAVVYDHLGDVHEALKQRTLAVEAWEVSYRLSPTNSIKLKLEHAGRSVPPVEDPE
jgi:tetratricopeptide (TPR) repeat protein